jgi:hypothetical protein
MVPTARHRVRGRPHHRHRRRAYRVDVGQCVMGINKEITTMNSIKDLFLIFAAMGFASFGFYLVYSGIAGLVKASSSRKVNPNYFMDERRNLPAIGTFAAMPSCKPPKEELTCEYCFMDSNETMQPLNFEQTHMLERYRKRFKRYRPFRVDGGRERTVRRKGGGYQWL